MGSLGALGNLTTPCTAVATQLVVTTCGKMDTFVEECYPVDAKYGTLYCTYNCSVKVHYF